MKSRLGFSKKLLLLLMLAAAALLAGLTSVVRLSSESGNRLLMAELRQVMNSDLRSLAMQRKRLANPHSPYPGFSGKRRLCPPAMR